MQDWYDNLISNTKIGDTKTFNEILLEPSSWPKQALGVGFMRVPRGGLAYWIVIKDEDIKNYQAIVPSIWNAGRRDASDQSGAYEAALADNHVLHDVEQPV